MPSIIGLGLHIWSAIIIVGILIWGYYVLTAVRKYSRVFRCVTIIVSTVLVLTIYWFVSPLVGVEMRVVDRRFTSVFAINLSLLVLGAGLVTFLKFVTFDKIDKFREQ